MPEVVDAPKRGRGRPKLSAEQLIANKIAAQERRKAERQVASARFATERSAAKEAKAIERQRLKDEAKANAPSKEVIPKRPVYKDAQSPEWYAQYVKEKVAYEEYIKTKNKGVLQTFVGERVFRFD
jgi:hypothetical protein